MPPALPRRVRWGRPRPPDHDTPSTVKPVPRDPVPIRLEADDPVEARKIEALRLRRDHYDTPGADPAARAAWRAAVLEARAEAVWTPLLNAYSEYRIAPETTDEESLAQVSAELLGSWISRQEETLALEPLFEARGAAVLDCVAAFAKVLDRAQVERLIARLPVASLARFCARDDLRAEVAGRVSSALVELLRRGETVRLTAALTGMLRAGRPLPDQVREEMRSMIMSSPVRRRHFDNMIRILALDPHTPADVIRDIASRAGGVVGRGHLLLHEAVHGDPMTLALVMTTDRRLGGVVLEAAGTSGRPVPGSVAAALVRAQALSLPDAEALATQAHLLASEDFQNALKGAPGGPVPAALLPVSGPDVWAHLFPLFVEKDPEAALTVFQRRPKGVRISPMSLLPIFRDADPDLARRAFALLGEMGRDPSPPPPSTPRGLAR
jgi:hypothetical protein